MDRMVTQEAINKLAANTVLSAAWASPKDDRDYLLKEMEHQFRAAMIRLVWAMEAEAGKPLGSTQSIKVPE